MENQPAFQGTDPETEPIGAFARFAFHMRCNWTELTRRAPKGEWPVWTPVMTTVAMVTVFTVIMVIAFDGRINTMVRESDLFLRDVMRAWTDLVRSQWYLVPSAVLFCVAGFARWERSDSVRYAAWKRIFVQSQFVFVSVSGALMATNILKFLFGRARPVLFEEFGSLYWRPLTYAHEFASFPSGHSTTAATVTVILMLWFPRLRWVFLAAGLYMGASRIAADAHYPSDVVAGLAVGFLFTIATARWMARKSYGFRVSDTSIFPKLI